MQELNNILTLRVLLCLYQEQEQGATVTGISRTLGEEKYTISRVFTNLEEDGYLNRQDTRHPKLTKAGLILAEKYNDRVDLMVNHLLYEGVDTVHASQDALHMALDLSDATVEAIRSMDERYRVKYELRGRSSFDGGVFCRAMRDGVYHLPFMIYRENAKRGSNISMADGGFEHPCTLIIKDGKGTIQLKAINMTQKSRLTEKSMSGKIKNLKYFDSGDYISAEMNGDIVSFPAETLKFVTLRDDSGDLLHGSVAMQMTPTVGAVHMPTSSAIFTVLL